MGLCLFFCTTMMGLLPASLGEIRVGPFFQMGIQLAANGMRPNGGARPGAGRKPKEATLLKKKLADYADCALEAFMFNVELMRDESESKSLRREASREVMDRLWGKPKQSVEVGGENGGPLKIEIVSFAGCSEK